MSCSSRLALVLVLAASTPARADKAAADVAFSEAKKLIAEGKIAEACPKFELSHKEDPQIGTLLNLADCHEKLGKLAMAWAEFREAIDLAKNRRDEREGFARERSEKLAPRVSYVTLVKQGDATNLRVSLDGRDVTALVGVGIPIDPGEHVIVTSGDGPEATTTVKVTKDGQKLEVRVPVERAEPVDQGPAPSGRTRRIAGLATAGTGLVVAGIGLVFGKKAFDQYEDSRQFCDDANRCDPQGAKLIDDANSSALKSNILIGVGVGAVAVGAVLWLTAPKERRSAVTARPVVAPDTVAGVIELQF